MPMHIQSEINALELCGWQCQDESHADVVQQLRGRELRGFERHFCGRYDAAVLFILVNEVLVGWKLRKRAPERRPPTAAMNFALKGHTTIILRIMCGDQAHEKTIRH